MVIQAFYKLGTGDIHRVEDIFSTVSSDLSKQQFDFVIKDLAEGEIITQTGKSGEIVFVSNLTLAHLFGVCVTKQAEYDLNPSKYGLLGQLSLFLPTSIERLD